MKTIYKIYTVFLLLIFIGVAFVINDRFLKVEKNVVKQEVSLRLKWNHQSQFAGFYLADQQEYYQKDGLDVKIDPIDLNRQVTLDYILSGENDIAIGAADEILIARSEGKPVKAVAVIFKVAPLVYLAKAESNIHSPLDFAGKTVALSPGQGTYLYESMSGQLHIDRSKINEIPMTSWDLYECWKTADVCPDYATNGLARAKNDKVSLNAIWPGDYGLPFYADVIFTTDAYIANHPDIVAKFVKDSIKGWQMAIENPQKAVAAVMKVNPELDQNFQLTAMEISIPLINTGDSKIGFMDKNVWSKMQEILVAQKLMTKTVDIDSVFTNEFVQ